MAIIFAVDVAFDNAKHLVIIAVAYAVVKSGTMKVWLENKQDVDDDEIDSHDFGRPALAEH